MSETLAQSGVQADTQTCSLGSRDWLTYYSECLGYELVMGQKFTTLLGQASLFSFTASAAIITLAEKLQVRQPANVMILIPSALGLVMYSVLIDRYFLQIRETGSLLLKIEDRLEMGSLGLLHVLRGSRGVFYGRKWTRGLVWLYLGALLSLPIAAVIVTW